MVKVKFKSYINFIILFVESYQVSFLEQDSVWIVDSYTLYQGVIIVLLTDECLQWIAGREIKTRRYIIQCLYVY